jgi:hypothetical protein
LRDASETKPPGLDDRGRYQYLHWVLDQLFCQPVDPADVWVKRDAGRELPAGAGVHAGVGGQELRDPTVVRRTDSQGSYETRRGAMTPHPHAEIIKAWADGHTIQFRSATDRAWNDIEKDCTPAFLAHLEYRIKSPASLVTQEYHVYLPQGYQYPALTDAYPANARFVFEDGKLMDVELIADE